MTDEKKIEAARARMTQLALGLQTVLPPMEVVGLLIGAATGILLERGPSSDVAAYMRALADELEADQDNPVIGRA